MGQETRSSLDHRVSETIPEEGTSHHDYQVLLGSECVCVVLFSLVIFTTSFRVIL